VKAVIVSHGDVDPEDLVHLRGADLVIAADGGVRALDGRPPDVVIGDLDSIAAATVAELERRGVKVLAHPVDKDESDTELAVRHALSSGAEEIVVLGALGGARFDHSVANALLLADPALVGRDIRVVDRRTTLRALRGPGELTLGGAVGDLVSLLPLGEASGIRTFGLRYVLAGEPLRVGPSRGLSNVIASAPATVACEGGALLVIEIRQGGSRS
jgi:thiamine pyrophosphokinase